MPTVVDVTSGGEPDFRAMEAIVGAFADLYGIDSVDVSHFPEADNIEAAAAEIAAVQQEIANGRNYNLFNCNCGDISDRVLVAAGAQGVDRSIMRPNTTSDRERRRGNGIAEGRWSGRWVRLENGRWGHHPNR